MTAERGVILTRDAALSTTVPDRNKNRETPRQKDGGTALTGERAGGPGGSAVFTLDTCGKSCRSLICRTRFMEFGKEGRRG